MARVIVNLPGQEYSMGAIIKKYREQAGHNQAELAQILSVNKNTVYNWESNKFTPDASMIRRLCAMLHMPIQELFNVYDSQESLSLNEKRLLSQFQAMSPALQTIALETMTAMVDTEIRQHETDLKNGFLPISIQNTAAAAGPGCAFIDDPELRYCFVRANGRSQKADTIFRVSGRSMEPVYFDGDLLYVQNADDGCERDDLICSTADGVVVKRMDDKGRLYSVNPDIPFGTKYEDDNVRVMGKVIGVVDPDDIAHGRLEHELDELFSEEIKELSSRQ